MGADLHANCEIQVVGRSGPSFAIASATQPQPQPEAKPAVLAICQYLRPAPDAASSRHMPEPDAAATSLQILLDTAVDPNRVGAHWQVASASTSKAPLPNPGWPLVSRQMAPRHGGDATPGTMVEAECQCAAGPVACGSESTCTRLPPGLRLQPPGPLAGLAHVCGRRRSCCLSRSSGAPPRLPPDKGFFQGD